MKTNDTVLHFIKKKNRIKQKKTEGYNITGMNRDEGEVKL